MKKRQILTMVLSAIIAAALAVPVMPLTAAATTSTSNAVYYLAYNETLVRRFVFDGTQWSLEILGTVGAPSFFRAKTIILGDARNDGTNRVYVGTDQIYEFTKTGASWVREVVSTLSPYSMDIGDGDNDGKKELYVGSSNKVYRIEWTVSSWASTLIGEAGAYDISQPIVGDVEGHDGLNEVYVSGYDPDIWHKGLVQFKWIGGNWIRTVLGGAEQPYYGIALGDGDNDGQNELYQMNANWPIFQYKWSAAGWSKMGINSYFLPTYPQVGDADNDGKNEVYVVRDPEHATGNAFQIWRHSWNGSSWIGEQIPAPNTRRMGVGDGDNDGKQELYAGETSLHQVRWNGSSWVSTEIGVATSTWIQYIAVGDGGAVPVQPTYTITATAGANGAISPSGAVAVNQGASQSFIITPSGGYHIADVLVDGLSVGAVASYTFSNVTANHTISASFAINTFTVTASAGANGTISPSGAVSVNYGANQTFTISPNTGYHVADVLVDGLSVGAVASYTFSNVAADHTIAASFAINPIDHYSVSSVSSPQVAGTSFSVTIQAQDQFNNNITSGAQAAESINITFGLADAGATPTTTATTNGAATVSMTMTKAQSGQSITFVGATSGKTGTSSVFTVNPGPLTTLSITQQPSDAVINTVVAPPVTVRATDAFGNVISGQSITVSKLSGVGTLSGTLTQSTDSSGIASFNDLKFDLAGVKALRFTSGAQTVDSNQFVVTATGGMSQATGPGDVTVDAKTLANTTVMKHGPGTPTIYVGKYSQSPGTQPAFMMVGSYFFDVFLSSIVGVTELEIRHYYTDAEVAGLNKKSLKLKWWDGSSWITCSDSGVNTARNYIWAKVRSDTSPSLAQMTGTPFSGSGVRTVVPTLSDWGALIMAMLFVVGIVLAVKRKTAVNTTR